MKPSHLQGNIHVITCLASLLSMSSARIDGYRVFFGTVRTGLCRSTYPVLPAGYSVLSEKVQQPAAQRVRTAMVLRK